MQSMQIGAQRKAEGKGVRQIGGGGQLTPLGIRGKELEREVHDPIEDLAKKLRRPCLARSQNTQLFGRIVARGVSGEIVVQPFCILQQMVEMRAGFQHRLLALFVERLIAGCCGLLSPLMHGPMKSGTPVREEYGNGRLTIASERIRLS